MNDSQTHLHSENFDLCRICLLEPESNRDIKFFHIFSPNNNGLVLSVAIMEFLGVIIDKDDVKPKIICQNCHKSVLGWVEMKKRAVESQVVINYIEKKRYAVTPVISSASGLSTLPEAYHSSSNKTDTSTRSINSNQSTSSSYSFTRSQSKTSISNNSRTKLNIQNNVCSSSTNKNNHNQSIYIDQSTMSSIDDQTSESDDDMSCTVVNVTHEVICISDSDSIDESIQNNKNECINNDKIVKLYYCSICKNIKISNHDCSQYNKEFSTCLMPNCNILSRSMRDFTPHYRQHIGFPAGAVLCRSCYRENKKSERDGNGCHNNCDTSNLFKCYTCNINLNSMAEFAFHKLKTHNGRLINSSGNYLCFYCEKSSPDLMKMNEHMLHCRENQTETVPETVPENDMEQKESEKKKLMGKNFAKKEIVHNNKKEKEKTIPRSSTHFLFTCLKPSCNLIFQNFAVFKFHHRQHFKIGNDLMCWQCCSPFSNLNALRVHQVKGHCRTPGMFKCYECSEKYNDLQSLSIHKFTIHNGELVSNKNNKKTIKCAYCKIEINVLNLKTHLIKCQFKKERKNMYTKPNLIKKVIQCAPFQCKFCSKICLTNAALSSHIKIHSNLPRKKKKSKSMKRRFHKLFDIKESEMNILPNTSQCIKFSDSSVGDTNNTEEPDEEINTLSSTYLNNGSIKYDDCSLADTNHIEETDEVVNTLPSTSQSNQSIKFDDCNMTNTNIIKETDEEVKILPSTSQNNGSIKSENGNAADMSIIIKETDEKINLTSNTFVNEPDNYDMLTNDVKLFSCSKCPKKFSCKRGMSVHQQSHFAPRNKSVKSYYCTKCKEYFTRPGFGNHWKLTHGKRLVYHKSKRYSCSECLRKFMYKIALQMHKEHKHSETESINETLNSSFVLPIKTENISLDNQIHLPILFSATSMTTEECEEFELDIDNEICKDSVNINIEVDNKIIQDDEVIDCKNNEEQNFSNEKDDNKMKQNDEVNKNKNNEEQDLSSEKDNDNTDKTQDNITQSNPSANMVKKVDGVTTEENKLSSECKTFVVEEKVSMANEDENIINSIVEENKIMAKTENQNKTEFSINQ